MMDPTRQPRSPATAAPASCGCTCARGRLRLHHADVDGDTTRWVFEVIEAGERVFVHATADVYSAAPRAVWHTAIEGLAAFELGDLAPEDYALGVPNADLLEELQAAIDEELARAHLTWQIAIDVVDFRMRDSRKPGARAA